MPKLPKYTWESCLSDIFVLSSIGKAWEKKIRGITHTKQGAKLFMDRIWSLYFRLLLYDITSFVTLTFIVILQSAWPISPSENKNTRSILVILDFSHGEKKEERLQSSKSSLLYKISQGQFGKKKSARGFCSRKAKLWLKPI